MFHPRFILESIDTNLKWFYLKDVTGNVGDLSYEKQGDGTYKQVTNDWGYGAPNPLRENLAVIFGAVHKQSKSVSWSVASAYSPTDGLVDRVAFNYPKDGHYHLYMFVAPVFVQDKVYTEGEYSFHPDGNKTPYSGEVKKFIGGTWEVREIQALADEYEQLPYKAQKEDVLYGKAYCEFGELDFDRREAIIEGEKCKNDKYEIRREWEAFLLIREIKRARCNSYHTKGEKFCRTIEAFLED